MKYIEVMNDELIVKEFNKIDEHSDNKFDHGRYHAENVIDNILKLAKLLNIDEEETNYLAITGILHDMGQLGGKDGHEIRGKIFAEAYLKDKVDQKWLDKILKAIEYHHEKENIKELSLFEHIVLIADKVDVTYKRLNKKYLLKNNEDGLEKHIKEVNFEIKQKIFKVIIKTDGKITKDDFYNWGYASKMLKRIEEFSDKVKMQYKIEII